MLLWHQLFFFLLRLRVLSITGPSFRLHLLDAVHLLLLLLLLLRCCLCRLHRRAEVARLFVDELLQALLGEVVKLHLKLERLLGDRLVLQRKKILKKWPLKVVF